jgi:rod shape-determining protein MreC
MHFSRKGTYKNPHFTPLIVVTVISSAMIALPLDLRTTVSRIGTLSLLYPFSELDKFLRRVDSTFEVNRQLNRKLDSLAVQVSSLVENKYENQRLRAMLDFRERTPLNLIPSQTVALSFDYPYKSMLIDVGYEKHIGPNMPVICPGGVIGKTMAAGWRSSTVQLLFDPACKIAVRIQASRAQGILSYAGGNFLTLRDVPIEESVLVGDSVVTSGLGGIFPEGLFVGTVIRTEEKEGGMFLDIWIIPGADFAALEEVFVISSTTPE